MQQSYGNCGIESSRALITAGGGTVDEQTALNWAVASGRAVNSHDPTQLGGTTLTNRRDILAHYGVASHAQDQDSKHIEQAVAEGRGVITAHYAQQLWNNPNVPATSGHAITVTGIEYDANGDIENVITNDTGLGQGHRSVPAQQFFGSLIPGAQMNVSDRPLNQ